MSIFQCFLVFAISCHLWARAFFFLFSRDHLGYWLCQSEIFGAAVQLEYRSDAQLKFKFISSEIPVGAFDGLIFFLLVVQYRVYCAVHYFQLKLKDCCEQQRPVVSFIMVAVINAVNVSSTQKPIKRVEVQTCCVVSIAQITVFEDQKLQLTYSVAFVTYL